MHVTHAFREYRLSLSFKLFKVKANHLLVSINKLIKP